MFLKSKFKVLNLILDGILNIYVKVYLSILVCLVESQTNLPDEWCICLLRETDLKRGGLALCHFLGLEVRQEFQRFI